MKSIFSHSVENSTQNSIQYWNWNSNGNKKFPSKCTAVYSKIQIHMLFIKHSMFNSISPQLLPPNLNGTYRANDKVTTTLSQSNQKANSWQLYKQIKRMLCNVTVNEFNMQFEARENFIAKRLQLIDYDLNWRQTLFTLHTVF